jgi:hypothetical protein
MRLSRFNRDRTAKPSLHQATQTNPPLTRRAEGSLRDLSASYRYLSSQAVVEYRPHSTEPRAFMFKPFT